MLAIRAIADPKVPAYALPAKILKDNACTTRELSPQRKVKLPRRVRERHAAVAGEHAALCVESCNHDWHKLRLLSAEKDVETYCLLPKDSTLRLLAYAKFTT